MSDDPKWLYTGQSTPCDLFSLFYHYLLCQDTCMKNKLSCLNSLISIMILGATKL